MKKDTPETTSAAVEPAKAPAMTEPAKAEPATESGLRLHMGIAEQGKVYALQGNHSMALKYYRYAMHMTVQAGDPEVFFRHYLECVIESLEHTGSLSEVLAYCEKAIHFYEEHPPPNPLAVRDLASLHERRGIVLLKLQDGDGARLALRSALDIARKAGQTMPLSATLSRWVESGMHVDAPRLLAEQRRAGYFSVRSDTVNAKRAIKLPNEAALMQAGP
jgi:tetratricopeptide (TPR) repeat protein